MENQPLPTLRNQAGTGERERFETVVGSSFGLIGSLNVLLP